MKPLPYQLEDLKTVVKSFDGRALIAWDMGLGKTAVALWYLRKTKNTPAVVVCPANVKWQWERQALQLSGCRAIVVCEGRTPQPLAPKTDLVIINYDILKDWVTVLKKLKPKTIILDEIQNTANKTQKTKSCRKLCYRVPHVIGLSGTPMLNKPLELFNGLNLIKPSTFNSKFYFAQRYCKPVMTPWGWSYEGLSNGQKLNELLKKECMVRRKKTEVLTDLPEKIRNVIDLPIRNQDDYQRANNDFLGWIAEVSPEKLRAAISAMGFTKVGYLLRLAVRYKLYYAVEWINDFLRDEPNEKFILYATHKKTIRVLSRRCQAKSVIIDGSITGRKRQQAVNQFANDPNVKLLIGNIQAAGTGIDGLQVASNAVFVEMPWQPGAALQAEDRIYRIGTRKHVWIWYLVARRTIEESICRILQKKQDYSSSVLDGKSINGDFNIFDQLIRELKGGTLPLLD